MDLKTDIEIFAPKLDHLKFFLIKSDSTYDSMIIFQLIKHENNPCICMTALYIHDFINTYTIGSILISLH